MALADQIASLDERLSKIEKFLPALEEVAKVEKRVVQVVVEREGEEIKVRRKILLTTVTGQKEDWEDASDKFDQLAKEELLNGA